MSDWSDAATAVDGDVRRDVRYVRSGSFDVFVSSWRPSSQQSSFGLLVCPAWGFEGSTSYDLQTALARAAAERGGLGVAFHYPGHGDSTGDPETATLDVMTRAAVDAAGASGALDGDWILAGLRLGAAVAALAAAEIRPARLLFVDGELDPAPYFDGLTRRARRARLAYPGARDLVYGVPLSDSVKNSAIRCNVRAAAAASGARVTSLRYEAAREDDIVVGGQGTWFARSAHPHMAHAAGRWLGEVLET